MAQHPHYPNLWEGPVESGEKLWFCYGRDIPKGASHRYNQGFSWSAVLPVPDESRVYSVKNVQLPDPEGWKQPDGSIVTLTKHIRHRTDLGQWEWHHAPNNHWAPITYRMDADLDGWADEFAVHIRRARG